MRRFSFLEEKVTIYLIAMLYFIVFLIYVVKIQTIFTLPVSYETEVSYFTASVCCKKTFFSLFSVEVLFV